MNEIQENINQENIEIKENENNKRLSDLDDFYRGAYRRGARRKTKGTASLVITIVLLSAVVLIGLLFVIGTFLPIDLIKLPVRNNDNSKVENVHLAANDPKGYEAVTERFEILTPDTLLKDSEDMVFADGILSYVVADLNKDGAEELLMISSDAYSLPVISVFESQTGEVKRAARYEYTDTLIDKDENSKSEIYISEADGKKYICVEKYNLDDFSWQIEVLSYENKLERMLRYLFDASNEVDDEKKAELSKYMINYTSADYSEGSELKMNGDAEGKILLCSFEIKDGKLEAHMY